MLCRDIASIMENQMEKNVDNEMETGIVWTHHKCMQVFCSRSLPGLLKAPSSNKTTPLSRAPENAHSSDADIRECDTERGRRPCTE